MTRAMLVRARVVVLAIVLLAGLVAACRNKPAEPSRTPPPPVAAVTADARAATAEASNAIDTYWRWFVAHAAELRAERDPVVTMERISAELSRVNPGVFAEIASSDDKRTLVLSADGKRELFPIVKEVFARRPTVDGWTIVAFRPRGDLSASIEMGGKQVAMSSVKFVAERSGGKLDVVVYLPGFDGSDQVKMVGFLVLDHTVGEYDMETKIGGVDFDDLKHAPRRAKSLTELPALVDAL